ncbi:MAG: phosphoribosylamine--glycine ligase [Candidatus Omnitrophica bacterium]|nr:phosphoribosylamine--glycine ligase [Candidatus Omnitrophota bacterium]MCM8800016.1 phosphoribosylamine--glycine ligase [Candidatus Omnitrophota bacterium]
MRVLVIGSGGREHALVWKIAQSKLVDKIFCSPGNGGISELAECLNIKSEDIFSLLEFARKEKIDLTIVGPEAPLAEGIVDEFKNFKLRIFGPTKLASRLEASKVFAKELMKKYNVPTADFCIFDNPDEARRYIEEKKAPLVVKADGLAQGKGVIVAKTTEEALNAVKLIMEDRIFGKAGEKIIVEDCLEGEEASIIVITDSREVLPLASSQDHKRVFDGDRGPNTGGMGAYSPTPLISENIFKEILDKIVYRIIDGLAKEGIDYRGSLYAGIMLTKTGPKVLEFNVRFGDPETQAILPRLKSDLVEAILAVVDGHLTKFKRQNSWGWDERSCICVVCASEGYPGSYEKGKEIFGLEEIKNLKDIIVFHAGTKKQDNRFLTNGGRVLGITGLGANIKEAIDRTYEATKKIYFEGMHYRKDIGYRALKFTTVRV